MPNWCSNDLVVTGDASKVAELHDKIIRPKSDNSSEMTLDFNGIAPMPEELLEVSSFCSKDGLCWGGLDESLTMPEVAGLVSDTIFQRLKAELESVFEWEKLNVGHINRWLMDVHPELKSKIGLYPDIAKKSAQNIVKYGVPGWYDWRIQNWGTKWNPEYCSISHSAGQLQVSFETAWSPPDGVYREICAAYPELNLVGKYIEEGMYFAGYYNNIGCDLYDHPCDDDFLRFAIEHFGYEYEDDE